MQRISLTDFVDIVAKSGTYKASKVKTIVNREDYHPAFDFYKIIRDQIVSYHKNSLSKNELKNILDTLSDERKRPLYSNLVTKYISWIGRKSIEWFEPPTTLYEREGLQLSINPELGLVINGQPHLVKLYFKTEPLSKYKTDLITHLMKTTLENESPRLTIMSVLDIPSKKLITPTVPIEGLTKMIDAELAYTSSLMKSFG